MANRPRGGDAMAMAIDPVCGMRVDTDDAAATADYEGETYYFCSQGCHDAFVSDPSVTSVASSIERDRLTEGELAERAGTTVERVQELVNLGLLMPESGTFPRRDVMRARVVLEMEAKGVDADALARAYASGHLTLGYIESAVRRFPRLEQTYEQIADSMGISFEMLQRVYVASGIPRPRSDEHVREEDLSMLGALPVLLEAGIGEGDVLRAVRIWGDSARRVAQFQTHYFHTTIEAQFRQRGLRDNEALEAALREVGVRMGHSGEEMLGWMYRRHAEGFYAEHEFGHVETALEEAGIRPKSPRGDESAVFADLSGYTSLTEEAGDEVAARVSLTLAQLVNEVAARHRGEVVKMLGDGVHFHFRDPGDSVRASLEIVDSVVPRGLPPAHVGVNGGPMIYDEGDYFGRTVNIAARIASKAAAGQVFVGEDLVRNVWPPRGFQLLEVGDFELKGIAQPVKLFQASPVVGTV
jgi:adenylate cyclase